ncbi:MAG: hypothetical protein AAYR33_07375 [Acetobacteraceae bacterium]
MMQSARKIDLAARLPEADDGEFAAHWQRCLDFLKTKSSRRSGWNI